MAYWPMERWDVRHLEGNDLAKFRTCFNQDYWASIPAIPGAVRACEDLCDAGYELVCVSALEHHFEGGTPAQPSGRWISHCARDRYRQYNQGR